MVDSVSNAAISTMLRAQSAGTSAGLAALKSNKQAAQAIIDQLQNGLDNSKSSMKQLAATPAQAPSSNLPRGSLVDILA